MYFRGVKTTGDLIDRQQDVLKLAKETNGWVFTGIHTENDWSRTRWWAAGWHLVNRTGDYAVVIPKYDGAFRLPGKPPTSRAPRRTTRKATVPITPITPGVQGLQ